jgi:drug/metabolite transporter (DMT)-like permease
VLRGVTYLLLAEFCFAASSVVAKEVVQNSMISGLQITFFRFFIGTILGYLVIRKSKESFVPKNPRMVLWRAIFNTISAMLFFYSLKYTTVTNANMLGMTYPLWVVLFAPLLIHEKFRSQNVIYVLIALTGVYLIVHPRFEVINPGDVYAFISGITASISIIALRQARKFDSTSVIIFYVMLTGLILNGFLLIPVWVTPSPLHWVLIIISALLGIGAQLFITQGYQYIEATRGSLISSSRIVMAGAMGVMFFSDQISLQIIAGALLIVGSQFGMIYKQIHWFRKN